MDEESSLWSPYIQDKITAVRKLPQATPELKQVKKEAAQHLRLETQLQTANMMKQSIDVLAANPNATREEIVEMLQKQTPITQATGIEAYVDQLIKEKNQVQNSLQQLEAKGIPRNKLAKEIFLRLQVVTGSHNPPVSPLHAVYMDTQYPAALVLRVSPEDYKEVRQGEEYRAYYYSFQQLNLDCETEDDLWVPIIVISSTENLAHEKAHAELQAMQKVLFTQKNKSFVGIWGNIPPLDVNSAEIQEGFVKAKTIEEVKANGLFERAISLALGRAKEEILADWDGSYELQRSLLTEEQSSYDYFEMILEIPPSSPVHKALWDEYTKRLTHYSTQIAELHTEYISSPHGMLKSRLKLMPFIFAQIPLEDMNRQIDIYQKELAAHKAFLQEIYTTMQMMTHPSINFTEQEEEIRYDLGSLLPIYEDKLSRQPHVPMYTHIQELFPQLQALKTQIAQTEIIGLSQVYDEVDSLWNRVCDIEESSKRSDQDHEYEEADVVYSQILQGLQDNPRITLARARELSQKLSGILTKLESASATAV